MNNRMPSVEQVKWALRALTWHRLPRSIALGKESGLQLGLGLANARRRAHHVTIKRSRRWRWLQRA